MLQLAGRAQPSLARKPAKERVVDLDKAVATCIDVGVDAVADGKAGDGCTGLQAFLNNLGLERFGVRASLAHGNPGDKGYRVRLKIRGHHRP